ncbi:hypothetical protein PIB30_034275 [Stylosanthes scabra]|uniref:Uncharacterized protein n=1 Tax=Stylosanthes scabra TaxID=79078 RepID=A0ABU6YB58_9FABA|nr:hypothetical protein [Stylosanthes scabra]
MDNCFEFTLAIAKDKYAITKDKYAITSEDLNKVKLVYNVKANFTLKLRYVSWGVFYGITCDEHFWRVQGKKIDSLYVPNVIPLSVMKSIRKKKLNLAYVDDSLLQNSNIPSALYSSTEDEDMVVKCAKKKHNDKPGCSARTTTKSTSNKTPRSILF